MYIDAALYSKVTGDGDVGALISTRMYPLVIPQDVDLEALAYQMISNAREMAHDGPTGFAWARYQITAQANTFTEVVDLINKVRIALDGQVGLWGGAGGVTVEGSFVMDTRDGYEFATERETRRMDVMVYYQE